VVGYITDLYGFSSEAFLEAFQRECNKDVETFADRLEHDEIERNSSQRVEHTEDLSTRRLRRAVAVTCQPRSSHTLFYLNYLRTNHGRADL